MFSNFTGHQILSSLFPRRALAFALVYDLLGTSRGSEAFLVTQFAILFALRRLVSRVPHSYVYFVQYAYAWVTHAVYSGDSIEFPRLSASEGQKQQSRGSQWQTQEGYGSRGSEGNGEAESTEGVTEIWKEGDTEVWEKDATEIYKGVYVKGVTESRAEDETHPNNASTSRISELD